MTKNRKLSNPMQYTLLQDAANYCINCKHININTDNLKALENSRKKCQHCRTRRKGIYKFDAIYTALLFFKMVLGLEKEIAILKKELEEKTKRLEAFKGKGKTSTVEKRYGTTIRSLLEERKSQREIAKITGKSLGTINKYLQSIRPKQ